MSKMEIIDENGNVIYKEEETQKAYNKSYAKAQEIVDQPDKLEKLLTKLEKKLKDFPVVGDAFTYLPKMGLMIQSYIKGEYKEIPLGTIISVVAGILYFVSPFDLIPDFLPGVGHLDDAAVIALCLKKCQGDIDEYMAWRVASGKDA